MGFVRWHVPIAGLGWTGNSSGGTSGPTPDWVAVDAPKKLGVFFLGTANGNTPWDYRNTISAITDGASSTIMLSENTLGGASLGPDQPFTNGAPTNWNAPHPNFVGFMASDNVCGNGNGGCMTDPQLIVTNVGGVQTDGASWTKANLQGTFENINYGTRGGLRIEGSFPFANSNHSSAGVIVGMCDGSVRNYPDSTSGLVWAKLLTPAGGTAPCNMNVSQPYCFKMLPTVRAVMSWFSGAEKT